MQVAVLKRVMSQLKEKSKKLRLSRRLQSAIEENERLKADLNKISTLLNSLPFPVWERDRNLKITYQNLAYNALLAEEEESSGSDDSQFKQSSSANAQKAIESSMLSSKSEQLQMDGGMRLFQITEIPLDDTEKLIGFAIDASSVSKEEDYIKSTAIYGPDMVLQYYNDAFLRLWQMDKAFLDSRPTYSQVITHLRDERKVPEQADFKAFKENRIRLFAELASPFTDCLYLPDGRSIQMEISRHHLGGLVFSFEEITERLSYERSYNLLSSVQKTVLEHLQEGVAVFGQNGRLTYHNSAYAHIWKLDTEYLAGSPHISEMLDLLKPLYITDDWSNYKKSCVSMLSERVSSVETIKRADGMIVKRICVPLPDGGMMISYLDITDLKVKEQKARLKSIK